MNGELAAIPFVIMTPQRIAAVHPIFAQSVELHGEEANLVHVVVMIANDALQRIFAGFFRRHAPAHVLDNGVGTVDLDVFLAAAGRARRAYVLITETSGADDGRIADPPG